jgi:Spy/CpxP family protein refolding chaperone
LQTKVGFTDQQIEQFNKLKEAHHDKLFPLFEEVRKTKDQFFLLVKDSPSDAYLDSMAKVIGEKQRALDRNVFETIREVRNICTPQQQAAFDTLLPKIAYKVAGHIRKGDPKKDDLKRPNR